MGRRTSISWVGGDDGSQGASVNPIRARRTVMRDGKPVVKRGWHCEHVHDGCVPCYAEGGNKFFGTLLAFKPGHLKDVEIFLDEEMLVQPLSWREPKKIFWCSMTDLYGHWVSDAWIDRIKAVQACTPWHTHIELTKRPARLQAYQRDMTLERLAAASSTLPEGTPIVGYRWPLPNVFAGPSVSRQADAEEFIPILLETDVAVRVVSLEPMLEWVDLRQVRLEGDAYLDAFTGIRTDGFHEVEPPAIDCVFVGGQSGGAALFELNWARRILAQRVGTSTGIFIKQLGTRAVDGGVPVPSFGEKDKKRETFSLFPPELQVREFPRIRHASGIGAAA
jgi:protein gp37